MESPIREFYKNANIFITGGSGFVGIAIIEKILRASPDVSDLIVITMHHRNVNVFFYFSLN